VSTTETEFWDVFARSGNPMLLVDDDRVYRDANPAACRLLRRTREEIVGHEITEFTPESHVGELDDVWEEFQARGHVVREWSFTDGEGRRRAIGMAAAADIPAPGSHLGVLISTADEPPEPENPRLSPRETEITRLLSRGLSGEKIAQELFLSPETVRTHIRNAMEHVGARTRAHLVAVALRAGLIEA
jgi:PAS domain S-box-containing protein